MAWGWPGAGAQPRSLIGMSGKAYARQVAIREREPSQRWCRVGVSACPRESGRACTRLSLSSCETWLRQQCREARIPHHRLGRSYRFSESDLTK